MAVFPVHTIAPCFHLVYEVLSACGCFSAVHDRKGCILHITFHFSILGLLQEVVCLFIPRNSFFSFFSGECLSLFRNMKPLLPALLIAPVFQVLQIRFAPLQLVTVLIIYGIDNKVRVYMPLVYMRGYQNLMPFPCLCMLCQLDSVLVSLLRGYFLVLMVGLHIMLIGSSVRLAPQLLCGLHFFLDRLRLTMQTADKLLLCLFFFRHIIYGVPYARL